MNQSQTPSPEGKLTVDIQHRTAGKMYTYTTTDASLKAGDAVLLETDTTHTIGTVLRSPLPLSQGETGHLKRVLHRATAQELHEHALRREKALDALKFCIEKTKEHSLSMKFVDAELVEGGKKIIFTFAAEDRVDFRSLVKELANTLHLRIEMRQVGARDETKYKGCLGACGQVTTCCSTFLRQFKPISMGMAKTQGLSPNPSKLTGLCGKLKCCLVYENELYAEARKGLPKLGAVVETPRGFGKISSVDILKRLCFVRLDDEGEARFPADDCTLLDAAKRTVRDQAVAERREVRERREEQHRERHERRRPRQHGKGK